MLVLSTLHKLLSQVLSHPDIHSAALLTPEGQLVSFACHPYRTKDDIRLLVGLSSEVWQEEGDQGIATVDSELGRIIVYPVHSSSDQPREKPAMLLAMGASDAVDWDELEAKARDVTARLGRSVSKLRSPLTAAPHSPPSVANARLAR
ncbi:hypothetical protein FA95DRAFT_1536172 [Auriscalpium vulgare]|uniref:Uncharacterized protein n=1 Tax=Auriscalpium vulgare TaxID=40419 RepID=A0ACB8S410_9AGAM|nr:hypothetical protein FA95DRAFT_1536172 [Auriscalpium vulgare]